MSCVNWAWLKRKPYSEDRPKYCYLLEYFSQFSFEHVLWNLDGPGPMIRIILTIIRTHDQINLILLILRLFQDVIKSALTLLCLKWFMVVLTWVVNKVTSKMDGTHSPVSLIWYTSAVLMRDSSLKFHNHSNRQLVSWWIWFPQGQ